MWTSCAGSGLKEILSQRKEEKAESAEKGKVFLCVLGFLRVPLRESLSFYFTGSA
jgi:hypothetical protein